MGFIDNIKILTGKKKLQEHPSKLYHTRPKKVLVVEDESALADTLGGELESAGFIVMKAPNGEIGLQKVKSEKPDLVLLDLLMPVMDGKMMLHKMREIPEFRRTPVIVLTNAGEIENIRETQVYYGAEEFMIKSNVSIEEIITRIRSLIGDFQTINPSK